MSLEQNDIYLLDKSGRTIYFNALHEVNYDSKFFIFNKTFYKDRLIKIFEENVEKINNTYLSNTNSNFLPTSISNVTIDISSLCENLNNCSSANLVKSYFEKNSISSSELNKLSENLLECFETSKNIFKTLKINVKICEKIRDNYNYQYNSLECIYKNISVLYEQCYNKYKELETDLTKMNEKNETTLSIFRDSIEKLKTVELHPKMQGPKERFLIDIYFDESKMNVWKEKCVKSSDFISKKIKSKGETIVGEKNKIRNEKNTNILQLKNE
jgi:hypothetical protein